MKTVQIFLVNLFLKMEKFLGKKVLIKLLNSIVKNQKFFYVDKIYDFDQKTSVSRLTVFLPGKGCEWFVKRGGCSMCAFGKKAFEVGKNFSNKDLLLLYEIAVNFTKNDYPFNLTIYNGGSFLNDKEISTNVQLKICEKVKNHPSIKKLFIESRVEFIKDYKIKKLKEYLGNKKLVIGIGLESQDERIRNIYIKKGLKKKDYEKVIKILHNNNVKVLTYVFLKPIYLSEKEAIEEAIKTIEYAFKAGTDEVALESAFIQEGTMMAKLFYENKYKPPWLWSIIEVIKKTYHQGPIHIGSFTDEPPPIATPFNCPLCSLKIRNRLQQYRETHNINLFDDLECECYELWKKEVTY